MAFLALFHQKFPHHPHVFMLQVVAMEHEHALKILEWLDEPYGLPRHNQHRVLKATVDKALVNRGVVAFISGGNATA